MKKNKVKTRYDFGENVITHKGKKITTSLNTNFENLISRELLDGTYQIGSVRPYIVNRPDTISDIFFDTPHLWWYIMVFNNLKDPFESLNPGDILYIPNINGVQ